MKPRLFVASSVEGLDVAYAVQENLEHDCEVTVWSQGVFVPSRAALEALLEAGKRFDAAAFVFAPDDMVIVRGEARPAVRDNVVFELGLFIAQLGRDRCFLIKPRVFSELHFPTDLLGVTPLSYDGARQDGNLEAAVGPACNKIRRALVPKGQGARRGPPRHENLQDVLLSRPFRLVFNPKTKRSKRMVFGPDGAILEGNNKNEHSWRVVNGRLELVQLDGEVHSRFEFDPEGPEFRHTNDPDTASIRGQYLVPDE